MLYIYTIFLLHLSSSKALGPRVKANLDELIKPRHISKMDIDMCGCMDNSNQIGKLVQAQMQSLGQSSFFFQRNCVGYHI